MYLSKHISAERPRGSDTSPSSEELHLQKEAPGETTRAARDRSAYLDEQRDCCFQVSPSSAAFSRPKLAASFLVAVFLSSAGAERRFLSCCPALNSSQFLLNLPNKQLLYELKIIHDVVGT